MLKKLWLGMRSLAMIALFPGTVTVYVPYRLLDPVDPLRLSGWSLSQHAAALVVFLGTGILLSSVWSFGHVGKGTLAPFDETTKLVISGLYQFVRNPMYVGVTVVLLGEAWFFSSSRLFIYAVIVFVVFHGLIIGYEERRLRNRYGDEYRRYCDRVGRWLPKKR